MDGPSEGIPVLDGLIHEIMFNLAVFFGDEAHVLVPGTAYVDPVSTTEELQVHNILQCSPFVRPALVQERSYQSCVGGTVSYAVVQRPSVDQIIPSDPVEHEAVGEAPCVPPHCPVGEFRDPGDAALVSGIPGVCLA